MWPGFSLIPNHYLRIGQSGIASACRNHSASIRKGTSVITFMIQPKNLIGAAILQLALSLSIVLLLMPGGVHANSQEAVWTKQEAAIRDQIRRLRSLPDDIRARTTKQLAI